MAEKKHLMVASLQLGRTYSCYAFSTRHDFMDDPLKIHINSAWKTGSTQFWSMSTPTCLLLNKDKEFVAFGYEAENEYADVILDGETDDYYFLKRFTTLLHSNKDVTCTNDMIIKDVTGKTLPASEVFKWSIKYLVSHLIQTLDKHGIGVGHNDLQWVLTIPSSCSETAKHIMTLSAERAGIKSDNLVMVPDSISAFVYCHTLRLQDNENYTQDNGEYMVIDLGGIAADITVFKYDNYQLIQRFHTTGHDCGGRLVNKHFFKVLDEIIGESTIKHWREDPIACSDIEREFEALKRTIDGKKKSKVNLTIPVVSLDKVCRQHNKLDFESLVKASKYVSNIKLLGDKMRIDADTFRNLFKSTIDNVISLIERVFIGYKDSHNVTHIIMAGGFSDCSLVQDAVKQKFPSKHIIITGDASLVVVQGSVLYGHQPCQYIRSPSHEMKSAQTFVTKCIFCDNPGIYHCTECTSAFCQQCRTKHDRLPTTKNHTVTDLKEIDPSAFSSNAMCLSHKSEFIYFCTRCHVLICGRCVTTEHKGHDITDIKTVADGYRRTAENNISELKVAVTKLSNAVGQMKKIDKPIIKITSESNVAKINAAVNKITKAVSFTQENKLEEEQNQFDMEMEEFQYDLKNKERIYEHQKTIYESLGRLMHVSHDITFITSYETLKRDIHDINDLLGEREQKQVYKFDKNMFVQEIVNAIVANFEMSLVGKEDGSVVLMHKTDIKKKEKRNKEEIKF